MVFITTQPHEMQAAHRARHVQQSPTDVALCSVLHSKVGPASRVGQLCAAVNGHGGTGQQQCWQGTACWRELILPAACRGQQYGSME
jgi:hypothetical protein